MSVERPEKDTRVKENRLRKNCVERRTWRKEEKERERERERVERGGGKIKARETGTENRKDKRGAEQKVCPKESR